LDHDSTGWAKRKVVSVGGDQSLITALKVMNEHKVSAVAVLNAAGKITANLSVSDLKVAASILACCILLMCFCRVRKAFARACEQRLTSLRTMR